MILLFENCSGVVYLWVNPSGSQKVLKAIDVAHASQPLKAAIKKKMGKK